MSPSRRTISRITFRMVSPSAMVVPRLVVYILTDRTPSAASCSSCHGTVSSQLITDPCSATSQRDSVASSFLFSTAASGVSEASRGIPKSMMVVVPPQRAAVEVVR
ncbi:hypothetical protein FQZ97_933050 [compost metagenome]